MNEHGALTSLELTHVLYDDSSYVSLGLALMTLSPILLMASYAALAIQTREFLIITMWAGQLAGELLNFVIKRIIKQERPPGHVGNGYGFPSSHSQYMAYFSSFLICHLYFRHRFSSTGFPIIDFLWRVTVYVFLLVWTSLVAYSRYHLGYHDLFQIYWGLAIGASAGVGVYLVIWLLPIWYPNSAFGRTKRQLINHPVISWLQVRDGWAIWPDGGRTEEWRRWRVEWENYESDKKKLN